MWYDSGVPTIRPELTKRPDLTHKRTQPERAQPGIQRKQWVVDFRRSAGWWRGLSASPIPSEPGNGWKPLVSLTDRASCSCFVRLCVSEGRFVTSGQEAYITGTWWGPDQVSTRTLARGTSVKWHEVVQCHLLEGSISDDSR